MVTTEHALSPCNGNVEKFAATASIAAPKNPPPPLPRKRWKKEEAPQTGGTGSIHAHPPQVPAQFKIPNDRVRLLSVPTTV
jgi:hypothetical protein